ncbi:anoctamin-5-like [Pararge aegeria]|uniref:Anoctamin n=1 Tax=Pararge aegeria aegeria TaxID=348720 RepID=A0A8S4R617_9NEOP|nr:anoctamin-5-like [Pararge aegeria]CAH2230858.1 jg15298 [Pararge aegeria aegeria]
MEGHHDDLQHRIRMNTIKCDRFKTLREDPPSKKYLIKKGFYSVHQMKILPDFDSHQDKANQVSNQVSIEEEETVIEEVVNEEEAVKEEAETEEVEAEEEAEEEYEEETKGKGEATVEKGIAAEKKREVAQDKQDKGEAENKDVAKDVEIPKVIEIFTGRFKDGKRRIDIVLVVEDDASSETDRFKLDFLSNILRIGLEIEIETGQMEIHEHLCFIKVHAPDSVLKEYGNMFAVKRYFANNRLGLNEMSKVALETDWLKKMRSSCTPEGYSNYERSLIVYKIFRHLPFGEHVNQYGLIHLLKKNIILDAYALHDGPYSYVPNQTDTGVNGRQLLYYNWVGLQNVFKYQPLHVIHEYFGPKIAFYYAFYGFYNTALSLASIAGVLSLLMPYLAPLEPKMMKEHICDTRKFTICPKCYEDSCPRRNMTEYCGSIGINVHLDHRHVLYFSIFMTFWALILVTAWRRKEYVLNWMWEVGGRDSYYETSKRPEFKVDYKNPSTGLKYDEKGFYRVLRISLSIMHTCLCLIASLAIMQACKKLSRGVADAFYKNNTKKPVKMEFYYLALFQILYTLFISALEVAFHFFYYYIVDLENHKSYRAYEKSLITKQFEFSITFMFSYMCYYAWLHGSNNALYPVCLEDTFSPLLKLFSTLTNYLITPWPQLILERGYDGPDCYNICFPFTCIIELSVLLIIMLFLKQVIFRVTFNNYKLLTDYNETREISTNVSFWEREYKLSEFNESMLTRKYMILALQFSLVTLFVIAFPLAPLIVLVVNVWDMRQSARQLLLASRRPLLIRSPGIGAWNNIILFIACASIFTNALNIVLTSKTSLRKQTTGGLFKPITEDFYDLYYLPFTHLDYVRRENIIYCRGPYLLASRWIHLENQYSYINTREALTTRVDYYQIHFISFRIFYVFVLGFLSFAFIIQHIFGPYRRDVEETRVIENRIKNLYAHYDLVENNSKMSESRRLSSKSKSKVSLIK